MPARRGCAATRRRFRARRRSGKGGCAAAPPSWSLRADGHVLVRTRAPKGLLGGMTEVPTTEWTHDFDQCHALVGAPRVSRARPKWRRIPGVVTHVFTHFPLQLTVYTATVAANTPAPVGMRWVALAELAGEALPNVMRKVVAHAFQIPAGPANLPGAEFMNVKPPTGRVT